ncbi:8729_t:CDS:10 [Rhizophagus irregularis]|nr:8729_t:CDS:10 [Rhizophagus irregularis]
MTNYYWIIAQHSGKVLEVEGGSVHNCAKIIQYTKKSEDDPSVDTQLWFFDGGFIINKISGLVIDVLDVILTSQFINFTFCHQGAQIIQHKSFPEPVHNQEWDYNYEDNSIRLRSNRKFVLDVAKIRQEDATPLILYEDLCGPNQKFTLQKWNYTSVAGGSYSEANIMQYHKKHENDCSVGTQLWFFDGGLITNKRSGLVLDVTESTQIIQRASGSEPSVSQEWDYNYEDNTISLRSNRNFVLDIKDKSKDNWIPIILHSKHDGQNQRFNLLKWNNNSGTDAEKYIKWIMDMTLADPAIKSRLQILQVLKNNSDRRLYSKVLY